MLTHLSHPIYQEALAINRTVVQLTKGYHSNGNFNLAFKIKEDCLQLCNQLDQATAARYDHTFETYYKAARKQTSMLLEHIRIANAARMLRGGFPKELIDRIELLKWKINLLLEFYQTNIPLDYRTLSGWAHQKHRLN